MKKNPQPATKNYFFEQCYIDTKNVLGESFENNKNRAASFIAKTKGLTDNTAIKIIKVITFYCAAISVYVFGTIFTLLFSLSHVISVFVPTLVVYLVFGIVWSVDRLYLLLHRVAVVCPECQNRFIYPVYVCPKCGTEHDHLVPGVYGVFHRKCAGHGGAGCGNKLPTSVLNFNPKRKDLETLCPRCRDRGERTVLNTGLSRPLCVPVVGAPSVGKSAFITAYVNTFVDEIALERGLEIEFYSNAKALEFQTMQSHYRRGQIVKTAPQNDPSRPSSVAFNFFIRHNRLKPDRLMYLYDIAGETFIENSENEMQRQYAHCQGVVLVIDPLSIPMVRATFDTQISEADRASADTTSLEYIMESFIQKLQFTTGLSAQNISKIPLAVAINKVDVPGVNRVIGDAAIRSAMSASPQQYPEYFDAMDDICQQFLRNMDAGYVVDHIRQNFKTVRFFAVSAMGHTVNMGRYHPHNVVAVMDWIINQADKPLASLVGTTLPTNK